MRVGSEDATDTELVEEAVEAVDVVLLWWREGDGDLVDGLVDAFDDRERLHLAADAEVRPTGLR